MAILRVTRGVPSLNIQIGPIKDALGSNPDLIVSVTDYFEHVIEQHPRARWVPINELAKTWGYKPFFAFKRIMDYWTDPLMGNPFIYVGCSAGVHRSPMSVFCWMLSKGYTPEQAQAEFYGHFKTPPAEMYANDLRTGYIPPNLMEFYKLMDQNPSWSYMGVLQGMLKYEEHVYTTADRRIKKVYYDRQEGLIVE